MNIDQHGAFWFRFYDLNHARNVLATLEGAPEATDENMPEMSIIRWGGYLAFLMGDVHEPTGAKETVNGFEVDVLRTKTGFFVLLLTPDIIVPEGLGEWSYDWGNTVWPIELGGWAERIEVSQEQAEVSDDAAVIRNVIPRKLTKEDRESLAPLRAQQIATQKTIEDLLKDLFKVRDRVERYNKRIANIPLRVDRAEAAVTKINDALRETRDERNAADDIFKDVDADDATRAEAKEEKDRLNEKIVRLLERKVSNLAFIDSAPGLLTEVRDLKAEAVAERAALFDDVKDERAFSQATRAALKTQINTLLGT